MGRTILCKKCQSTFNESALANRENPNICPVCGGSLIDDSFGESQKETIKWYYYDGAGGILTTTLYDDEEPLYTFEATDMKDAEGQLKEILPNSPLVNDNSPDIVRCPRCKSTQIQMVPRKFSLLTGFATNKFDRMCVRCQKRF